VAVSPSLEWMVGARVVQAIGGGATVPIGLALASSCARGGVRRLSSAVRGCWSRQDL